MPISSRTAVRLGFVCVAVLFSLSSATPTQAENQNELICQRQKPINLKEVLDFIAIKKEDRAIGFLESCHASFALDGAAIDQLLQAGASKPLFDAVNKVTAADLTVADAHAQASGLEQRIQQIDASVAAERDRALAKFDADCQAERQKAAPMPEKGEFQSTAEYNKLKQQHESQLAQLDRRCQSDRSQLSSTWSAKAAEKEQPYRARIDFLKSHNYPDPRPVLYKSFDADTLTLTATLDGQDYRFEKVPAATAQTLKTNWPKVKVAQPFAEDAVERRFLVLSALPSPIPGYSIKAKSLATAENHLATARDRMNQRNYDAAAREYRLVLDSDPNNAEAKQALAQIQSIQLAHEKFFQDLPASGVWLDPKTQLMWTMKRSERTVNWNDANAYCQAYSAAGLPGWRLPTIDELKGIYDESVEKTKKSAVPGQSVYIHVRGPVDVTGGAIGVVFIWSSTKSNDGGAFEAWFDMGQVDAKPLDWKVDRHALCVRQYNPATDGVSGAQ